ncbi:kinesin light chain [Pochonia chlamydosporia 170]|uniref:Kinesin light chain n=1 Tax=Pochonia chlamydosporia 170 TaxID=1380566 RepID=A0A179F037_METCM|nr:kinesin light chain [Pochonia chlamydosporia 170]OAQ58796.1 kinesin light chain [Pochonia chlamydosporia 170]
MFRWYRDAKRCYVYLSDVSDPLTSVRRKSTAQWDDTFRQSRWFTRGWTLQELIAPKTVDFYSKEGAWLGDKQSLEPLIRDITGIPVSVLRGTPLSDFPVSEREAWVRGRLTKCEEDMAYSLLGIFGVHMPLIYGEGRENAQRRLREEVQKAIKGTRTNDFSVTFSLSEVPEIQHFIAREREIAEVRRTLSSDGTRRIIVLHGLGGIGKTQLAVTYIKRYRDEHSAIFWFNIKDESSIQQSFTKVARQILQQHPNASRLSALDLQQNHNEVVEAVKAWLNLPGNTRWLIVYDNYDNPKLTNRTSNSGIDINRFIPTAHQGSIIVTTRLSQVDIGHPIRVRKLESTDDSLKILSSTSGRAGLQDDVDAKRLVEKLDGLPLALVTAGAYLRRVSTSLADYLRIYEKSWARLHTSTPSLGSYEDRTLCSTWQVSYQQVQEQNPLAAHLLRWWAYFDNEDIWLELLQPVSKDGPAWIYDLADELNFNGAMGTLHDYGFVEPHVFRPDLIESRGYSIHGCLHSWAIHILNQEWDSYLGKLAVECIASRVPSQNHAQFWLLQRRLLSHAMTSCATIQASNEDLYWVFHNLGLLYADQGKLQEAKEMYLRALRGKEKAWGPDHTSTLDTVNNLGILYKTQGKPQEAEEMYSRALRGCEKAWGPDHTSTLSTVNNLGNLYADQDKLQEAEKMYLRALRGYKKVIEPQNITRYRPAINTRWGLGSLLWTHGQLVEARTYYQRAYSDLKGLLGSSHKDVQSLQNTLLDLNRAIEAGSVGGDRPTPTPTQSRKNRRR